jgi:hypothetical protein
MHEFFVQTSFLCLEFGLKQTFVRKIRAKKLMKLTTDPKSAKIQSIRLFALFGSAIVKAARKMLVKLTPYHHIR